MQNAEMANLVKDLKKKPGEKVNILKKMEGIQLRLEELNPGGAEILTPSFLEGNCTSEALSRSLNALEDQSVLSFSPEAGELVRVAMGKYNKSQKGDFDLLLSGWSSEAISLSRISRGRINLKPTISALWFVQPFILNELVENPEAFERGLTARLLIFDSQIELQHDDGEERCTDPHIMDEWRAYIEYHLKKRPTPQTVTVECSPEAKEVFRSFYNETVDLRRGRA